jgi:hypothetical protein
MPAPGIEKIAKECNKTKGEVEKYWEKAKEIAKKQYKKSEKDDDYWKIVYGITKKMACGNKSKKESLDIYLNAIVESYLREDENNKDSQYIDPIMKNMIIKTSNIYKSAIKTGKMDLLVSLLQKFEKKINPNNLKLINKIEKIAQTDYKNIYSKVNKVAKSVITGEQSFSNYLMSVCTCIISYYKEKGGTGALTNINMLMNAKTSDEFFNIFFQILFNISILGFVLYASTVWLHITIIPFGTVIVLIYLIGKLIYLSYSATKEQFA